MQNQHKTSAATICSLLFENGSLFTIFKLQNAIHYYTVSENLVNIAIAPWEFNLNTNKLSFLSYISTNSNNNGNNNNNSYV